jgi:hypothetical protein
VSQALERGVLTEPPAPPAPPEVGSRRGWRFWTTLVITILVLGGLVFLSRLEPISTGNYGLGVNPPGQALGQIFPPGNGPSFELNRVPFRQGQSLTWGYSIINDGPIGITVTGVDGIYPDWAGPLKVTEVLVGTEVDIRHVSISPGLYERFRPFSLAPGQQRMILFHGLMTNCARLGPGERSTYTGQDVHFRVLGIARTQWLPTPNEIEVDVGPNPCATG